MTKGTSVSAPVVRIGSLVKAIRKDVDSVRVNLTYNLADQILERIVADDDKIIAKFKKHISASDDIAAHCVSSTQLGQSPVAEQIRLAPSMLRSDFSTGVDLSDFLVSFHGKIVVLRSCFTVCVDDDSLGLVSDRPLNVYSKIWTRFLLVGDDKGLERTWPEEEANSFFDCVKSISEPIQKFLEQIYSEYLSQALGYQVAIHREHLLTTASYGVSSAAFNAVLSTLDKPTSLAFRNPERWQDTKEDISEETQVELLRGVVRKFFTYAVEAKKPSIKAIVDALRQKNTSAAFKVVAVDDGISNRGLYLAEIGESQSHFVGIAADKLTPFEEVIERKDIGNAQEQKLPKKVNVSGAPANATSTILALDIAGHL